MGPYIPPPHCCCQAPNLPWAPYIPPPHAAARPLICMGPIYTPPHAAAVQSLSWVPVRPPIAAVSMHLPHTLPCATFRSPHTAGVLNFLT
ncbi:unnamed protein product [Staurois parvus]|uniref:Uncharacterized protein n=1 Tax=Staurois parvus TaxID=386267 RepID=A0ABN9CKZ2_9NEOB|nr:unnamed protein product [Staurois parvus]